MYIYERKCARDRDCSTVKSSVISVLFSFFAASSSSSSSFEALKKETLEGNRWRVVVESRKLEEKTTRSSSYHANHENESVAFDGLSSMNQL